MIEFDRPREPVVEAIAKLVADRVAKRQVDKPHGFDCECPSCSDCDAEPTFTAVDLRGMYAQGGADERKKVMAGWISLTKEIRQEAMTTGFVLGIVFMFVGWWLFSEFARH